MARSTTNPARPWRSPRTTHRAHRRAWGAAVVALALVGLAACSSPAPEVPAPVTTTPTVEPSRTTPPEPEVPVVWPLTGVPTDEVADRPALAVKIENTSAARPQTGLDQADVVWETIVEFEVSRLIAVFHSQVPAEVGPIRSVRPMDPPIVRPLGGLLAFSGGQAGILKQVTSSGVQALSHDAGAAGMYRVSFRSAPHNVYGEPTTFWAAADSKHSAAPAEQFVFARSADLSSAVVDGASAKKLDFRLSGQSRPSWVWSSGSSAWLRSESGVKATNPEGSQLRATNVVAITAAHPSSGFRAQGGASVPTYDLIGSGSAVVASGARTVKVTWKKTSPEAPLQLFDKEGAPVLLAPGTTWVELIPKGKGSLTVS